MLRRDREIHTLSVSEIREKKSQPLAQRWIECMCVCMGESLQSLRVFHREKQDNVCHYRAVSIATQGCAGEAVLGLCWSSSPGNYKSAGKQKGRLVVTIETTREQGAVCVPDLIKI